MSWLVEGPWTILIVGALIEVALLVALVSTGRALLLAAIAGVAVLTGGLLVVERAIVTERERIESTLDDLSVALVSNNLNAVLDYISPSADDVRALAKSTLPQVVLNEAHVGSDLTITVNDRATPPTAIATFTGRFHGKSAHGSIPYENFVRRFRVGLTKEGDRWLISGVEQTDLRK